MSSDVSQTTQSFSKKYIIISVISLVLVGVFIYYVFFHVSKNPNVCPQDQVFDSTTNKCIPVCPADEYWNGKNCIPKCDTTGHKTNPITGKCDPWPADCSGKPVFVNGENGGLDGTILSDDKFSCLAPFQWSQLKDEQNVLNGICKSNQCTCKTASCKFEECKTPQPFQAFSIPENGCVIKRNCGIIPSDFAKLFPSLNIDCNLFKVQDPKNEYACIDLNLDDLRQKCVNDKDGCQYGYSYDGKTDKCINKDGISMSKGEAGCRLPNDNREFNGTSCGNISIEYVIVTDIKNVTSTSISGQLSFTKKPKQYPQILRYLIMETNDDGTINYNGQLRFFDLSSITPSSNCDMKVPSDVECLDFTINLTGNAYDKPMKVLTKYRMLILGYNEVNGVQTPLTCSLSALTGNVVDKKNMGDIVIPTVDDIPTGSKLQLMPILDRIASDAYASKNGKQVINQLIARGNTEVKNPDIPVIPSIDENMLPYTLCTCTPDICQSNINKMFIIISWKKVNTVLKPTQEIRYYLFRNSSTEGTHPTVMITRSLNNDKLGDTDTNGYFTDLLPINGEYTYQLGAYIADKNDQVNDYLFYSQNFPDRVSALRYLIVDVPSYTKALCQSISTKDESIPPFLLLDPTFGCCATASSMISSLGTRSNDWWCTLGQSGLNGFGKDTDVKLWDGSNSCSRVFPNLYPSVTNTPDIQRSLSTIFPKDSDLWFTGQEVKESAQCGCIPQTNSGSMLCPTAQQPSPWLQMEKTNGITLTEISNRLNLIDSFGQTYIDGYVPNQTNIDEIVGNIYKCPMKPNWGVKDCDPNDQECKKISQLSDCSNNFCDIWGSDSSGVKDSFTRDVKYIPTGHSVLSDACDNIGTFSIENAGTSNIRGVCKCPDGNTDPHCVKHIPPWQALPNCESLDSSGNCQQCVWQIPTRKINGQLDEQHQPFILRSDKKGCDVNPDPFVWAPIVAGYSRHYSDGDNRQFCEGSDLAHPFYSLRGKAGDSSQCWPQDYDSCGLVASDINNLKNANYSLQRDFFNITEKPGNDGSVSCVDFCKDPKREWGPSFEECQYSYDVNGKQFRTCGWLGAQHGANNVTCGCRNNDNAPSQTVEFDFTKINTDSSKGSNVNIMTGPMLTSMPGSTYFLGPQPDSDSSYMNAIWNSTEIVKQGNGFYNSMLNGYGDEPKSYLYGQPQNCSYEPKNYGFDPALFRF